jgi:F-type H+-transporting ATPase subunit c
MESIDLSVLAAIAAGLVTLGAASGIAKLASAAMDGIARQPEAAGNIRTGMIIAAALIEGVALFSCIICLLGLIMK